MMNTCKSLVLLLSLMTVTPAFAQVQIASELHDWKWDQSTILAAVSIPSYIHSTTLSVRSGANKPFMHAKFWPSSTTPKGLYMIVPGTGSDASSGTANLLADRLSKLGWDVVIVVNPFSLEFQKTFSADGLVGFPQKDLPDAVNMMNTAYQTYVGKFGRPQQVRILGYSLGATYSGLFSRTKLAFPVSQYVLLNPPVRFGYAMDQLDNMLRGARNDSEFTLFSLVGAIIPILRLATDGITQEIIPALQQRLQKSEYENKYVIGVSFGMDLRQITKNLRASSFFSSQEKRIQIGDRAGHITFETYLGLVLIAAGDSPAIHAHTAQSLIDGVNLTSVLAGSNRSKLVIVTNSDDFLLQPKDLGTLRGIGAGKYYLFNGGGHCGNYWTDSYGTLLKKIAL